jgi:hypothetical protein
VSDLELAIDLYYGVRSSREVDLRASRLFVVRLWDGMDGVWTDVSAAVTVTEALRIWNEKTDGGTRMIGFDEIDYYRIFAATTSMVYANGKELFRQEGS